MRFRVNNGQTVHRGAATYGPGEEFDATGDETQAYLAGGQVTRVDKPKRAAKTPKGAK